MDSKAHLIGILSRDQSKEMRDEIISYVSEDPQRIDDLVEIFLDRNLHWRFNQKAAWPLGILGRKYFHHIEKHAARFIEAMDNPVHIAVLRNIIRIFEDVEIPESIEGQLYERCFDYVTDLKQAVAVRCFSLSVLHKITMKHPDLAHELKELIALTNPHGTAGFKSRSRKILKALEKM